MVVGDDRRHRQLHRQQGGRGALPCRDRWHRRRDRRHDPGGHQTSEPFDPQRAACLRPADAKRAGQHQARDLGRAERAARRHLRNNLGAADPSRSARDGARRARRNGSRCSRNIARWIAPIGMSPRRVAKPWSYGGVDFEPEDRVFLMFGSANRDESMLRATRPLRHHPRHRQEHRLRRRPALLRGRLCLPRDGRRRRAAEHLFAVERLEARHQRARAYRRLGVPRAAQSARAVGSQLAYSPADWSWQGDRSHPNLSFDRSLAFSASVSRSRAGACVCKEVSSRRVPRRSPRLPRDRMLRHSPARAC